MHWSLEEGTPPAPHRELERLEEQLVGQQVDRQLLVAKGVHAVGRAAGRRPHLKHSQADNC